MLCLGPAVLAAPKVAFGPPAAWVEPLHADEPPSDARVDGGLEYRLSDLQVRFDPVKERYFHLVMRVANHAGIQDASQLSIGFDPSFERLTLHGVWILRDGRRLNALRPKEVKVVERESDLDQQLFDGTFTALIVLADVRVGDQVEYAYTLRGSNPVLEGHLSMATPFGWDVGLGRQRVRVVYPASRKVFVGLRNGAPSPRDRRRGRFHELLWDRRNLPALPQEAHAPPGARDGPWLSVTDFESWQEISRWAATLYPRTPPSKAMRRLVAGWLRLPPEARLTHALQFVQDEIRYFGFELGPHSRRPHAPEQVLANRFGDCKDKTFLLVRLLEGLGIDAVPALVSTRLRGALRDLPPSPDVFDHVIVRARLDGKTLFLDPTVEFQRGPLEDRLAGALGMALPVTREGEGLQAIPLPRPTAPTYDMLETYDASKKDGPTRLHVVTWFRGEDAREMREKLARRKLDDITRDNLDYYARRFPKVRSLGPNEAKDDPARDVITFTEDYEIDGFWEKGERQLDASVVRSYLPDPQATKRVLPLAVQDPIDVRTVTKVFVPQPIPFKPDKGNDQTLAGRLDYDLHEDGRTFSLEYHYRSTAGVVPADELPTLRQQLETLNDDLGFHLRLPKPGSGEKKASAAGRAAGEFTAIAVVLLMMLLAFGTLVAAVVIAVVLSRRSRKGAPAVAVAPEVIEALPVKTPSEPPTGT